MHLPSYFNITNRPSQYHPLIPYTATSAYQDNFFPRTIKDWNALLALYLIEINNNDLFHSELLLYDIVVISIPYPWAKLVCCLTSIIIIIKLIIGESLSEPHTSRKFRRDVRQKKDKNECRLKYHTSSTKSRKNHSIYGS